MNPSFLILIMLSTSVLGCGPKKRDSDAPAVSKKIYQPINLQFEEQIIRVDVRDTFSQKLVIPDGAVDAKFLYSCESIACPEQISVSPVGELLWKGDSSAEKLTFFELLVDVEFAKDSTEYVYSYRYTILPGLHPYQNGDQWSSFSPQQISDSQDLVRLSKIVGHGADSDNSSAFGTAFYLGEYEGEHLVATAKHVAKADRGVERCDKERNFVFIESGVTATCKSNVFVSSKFDFIIMSVTLSDYSKAEILKSSAYRLNRDLKSTFNHRIVIAGFGRYRSSPRQLTFKFDEDCRGMSDHDLKPTDATENYPVVACEASPGDSGAPLLDRDNLEIIGIVQGATMSKAPRISSATIQDYFSKGIGLSEEIGRVVYVPTSYVLKEIEEGITSGSIKSSSIRSLIESIKE